MPTIALPFPPSANAAWRVVGRSAIKSAKYRAWEKECALYLMATRQKVERVSGNYTMLIELERPSRRRMDCTNRIKVAEDMAKHIGMIDDDSLAEEVTVRWSQPFGEVTKNPVCWITVEPLSR